VFDDAAGYAGMVDAIERAMDDVGLMTRLTLVAAPSLGTTPKAVGGRRGRPTPPHGALQGVWPIPTPPALSKLPRH
jgi:hypothetical protein